jgi:hypothetical protein
MVVSEGAACLAFAIGTIAMHGRFVDAGYRNFDAAAVAG